MPQNPIYCDWTARLCCMAMLSGVAGTASVAYGDFVYPTNRRAHIYIEDWNGTRAEAYNTDPGASDGEDPYPFWADWDQLFWYYNESGDPTLVSLRFGPGRVVAPSAAAGDCTAIATNATDAWGGISAVPKMLVANVGLKSIGTVDVSIPAADYGERNHASATSGSDCLFCTEPYDLYLGLTAHVTVPFEIAIDDSDIRITVSHVLPLWGDNEDANGSGRVKMTVYAYYKVSGPDGFLVEGEGRYRATGEDGIIDWEDLPTNAVQTFYGLADGEYLLELLISADIESSASVTDTETGDPVHYSGSAEHDVIDPCAAA